MYFSVLSFLVHASKKLSLTAASVNLCGILSSQFPGLLIMFHKSYPRPILQRLKIP